MIATAMLEVRLRLFMYVALLLLTAAAVEQVHSLPFLGERSCSALQLARPTTAATSHWKNYWPSKPNLTSLLVVNGADSLSLEQALIAQGSAAGLEDKVCRAISYPMGDKLPETQKGCGTSATTDTINSILCIQDAHGQVSCISSMLTLLMVALLLYTMGGIQTMLMAVH